MEIRVDDLKGPEIAALLETHITDAAKHSPPGSVHALDLEALRAPEIKFWTAREGKTLLGCGALKDLGSGNGEIKSMHTAEALRGKGVAAAIVRTILDDARARGFEQLFLETGSTEAFAPARALYGKFGFTVCAPFGAYKHDPFSTHLTMSLKS